jgi:FkbM family methyltransferase
MLLNLKHLISKYNLKIEGVIHVGAHYGEEWPLYRELGIHHKVFFEAHPGNFKELERRAIPDFVWLENLALGNENKMIEMNCETRNNGQSNTLLEPGLCLEQYPDIEYNSKVQVKMIRMNDYHKDITPMNLLNMDVEGYELEVLKGATKHLAHIDYIICEVSSEERYKGQALYKDIDSFLEPFGFERIETDWGGINWGDAFYMKTKPATIVVWTNPEDKPNEPVNQPKKRGPKPKNNENNLHQ